MYSFVIYCIAQKVNRMGELQKRIKENLDVIPKPILVALQEWIEEMRTEYPSLESLGLVPKLQPEEIIQVAIARHEWFEKWLK